jgi:hypothetical protein
MARRCTHICLALWTSSAFVLGKIPLVDAEKKEIVGSNKPVVVEGRVLEMLEG